MQVHHTSPLSGYINSNLHNCANCSHTYWLDMPTLNFPNYSCWLMLKKQKLDLTWLLTILTCLHPSTCGGAAAQNKWTYETDTKMYTGQAETLLQLLNVQLTKWLIDYECVNWYNCLGCVYICTVYVQLSCDEINTYPRCRLLSV